MLSRKQGTHRNGNDRFSVTVRRINEGTNDQPYCANDSASCNVGRKLARLQSRAMIRVEFLLRACGIMVRIACLVFFLLPLSGAIAANTEAAKRRVLVPYARAASDCMAREVIRSPELVAAIKGDTLQSLLKDIASRCADQINTMIQMHDQLYGVGTGSNFFQGPYMDDLPRAVRARVQPQIDKKVAEADKADEVQRTEQTLREAERKADIERRESALRIEQQKREAEKAVALDTARRAAGRLRDKLYECTDKNLAALVKSGEGAEVLASAVMTICQADLEAALQSAIEVYKIDSGSPAAQVRVTQRAEYFLDAAVSDDRHRYRLKQR
ncbi:MAG: hypothetical protein ACREC0_11075 [Methylocella sp.]